MVTIDTLENIGVELGVSIWLHETIKVEFWTDTAGHDFFVDSTTSDPEEFIEQFIEYANDYDVDEEIEYYINMRGKNGVPSTVRELLDDLQETKDTLMKIADRLKEAK